MNNTGTLSAGDSVMVSNNKLTVHSFVKTYRFGIARVSIKFTNGVIIPLSVLQQTNVTKESERVN